MVKILRKIKNIKNEKIFIVSTLVITPLFAAYNLFLGIAHNYYFGYAIAGYFFLLSLVKFIITLPVRTNVDEEHFSQADFLRAKISSWLLFVVNFSLAAPVTMMVLGERTYDLGIIPAIATATYCTIKITFTVREYFKKQNNSPLFLVKKASSLVDSLVSVLTLQSTLIIANGETNDADMRILSAVSSFFIFAVIIFISVILQLKLKKNQKYVIFHL